MRTRGYATILAAGGLLIGGMFAPAAYADHTRLHTCAAAGGVFTAGAQGPGGDRCVVTTSVTAPPVPVGTVVTFGEPTPFGEPVVVDTDPTPVGEATTETETRDVGDAVVVRTERRGTSEVTAEERDAGEPVSVPVVVPGTPVRSTRTVYGEPTSTEAPGTRNCERVNNRNAAKKVER